MRSPDLALLLSHNMLSLTRKALEEFDNPQDCKRPLSAAICLFLVLLMGFPCASSARTLEDYLKAFRDKRPEVRRSALKSEELARCFSEDDPSCPFREQDFKRLISALIALTSDVDAEIRNHAAQYLASSTDSRAIAPLARLLQDRDDEVRATAAGAFVTILVDDDGIVSDLEKLLSDTNPKVRVGAAMSLGLNGTYQSLERLKEAYGREREPHVKNVLGETIKELAKRTRK